MVRELSVHQEHELLSKLEDAGLGKDLAQEIINSRDNALAKQIVNFTNGLVGLNDYKSIRKGIVIEATERNRQEILNNSSNYVLGDNFKKLLAKCTNSKTDTEVLREDELLKYKTDVDIKKEMKISEISIEQIAERIIYLGKIDRWTIIGYCNGLVVCASPCSGGRVYVFAVELVDWYGGYRLLSRDIEI